MASEPTTTELMTEIRSLGVRIDSLDARFESFGGRMDGRLDSLAGRIDTLIDSIADVRVALAQHRHEN